MVKRAYKTTVIFSLKDGVGVLCDALKPFKKNNVNLTRIISRPHVEKEWQYIFFVEIDGNAKEPRIQKALKELKKVTVSAKILASYPLRKA